MWPGSVLASALGFNYLSHLRGWQTICQWLREHLPPWAFALGWALFNVWFIPHVLRGYPRRSDLEEIR